jgi:flagellar hook protein FlgE
MFTAFSIALSALKAESTAIDVVGNNLANLNTTGFKASDVQFHDLISQTIGALSQSNQVGMGIGQINAVRQFSQGAVQVTGGASDAAIQGNGFFVVKDASNNSLYTRDGSFQVDATGNLITGTGEKVQGWSAVNGVLNPNGAVGNITLPLGAVIPANATTKMNIALNLNAQTPPNTSTDPTKPDPASQYSAPIQVFDSLGAAHTLTITFTHGGLSPATPPDPTTWDYTITDPNAKDFTTAPTAPLATGSLTFDPTGNLPSANTTPPGTPLPPISISIPGLADKANDLSINWNLYDTLGNPTITQFGQASGESGVTQDGFAAGQVTKVSIQDNGLVVANYSNGQQTTVAQLALANISNPDTLAAVGNNNLQATAQTAAVTVGTSGSSGLGKIVGGALESSNADIASEFTNLLTFQRSYQAASRVITTSDQLLQETVNLIHP